MTVDPFKKVKSQIKKGGLGAGLFHWKTISDGAFQNTENPPKTPAGIYERTVPVSACGAGEERNHSEGGPGLPPKAGV